MTISLHSSGGRHLPTTTNYVEKLISQMFMEEMSHNRKRIERQFKEKIMIVIDQRGCGQGKTTDGIYKRIRANKQNNIKSLVVVPSIKLQEQYKKDLDFPVEVINSHIYNEDSTDFNTTIQACLHNMKKGTDIIIITHQAFVKLPMTGHKIKYDLIIDEALDDIIRKTDVASVNNEAWQPDYDLYNLFEFENNIVEKTVEITKDDDEEWHQLHQFREPTQGLLSDSPSFKNITDKNFVHHVTSKGWHILNGQDGGIAHVISTLNPDILKNWRAVYIAAAAFTYTKMYHWMMFNKFQYYTPKEYRFVEHIGNIKLFTSDNHKFDWSNNKRKTYPEILNKYHEQVKQHASGEVITVRNNSETQNLGDIEVRLNHNVHGMNDLQEYKDISLETALIPDPQVKKFIIDNWLVNFNKENQKRAITHMFSAYLFYQVIMRTGLRSKDYNNERINIFVLDQNTGVCLMDYFEEVTEIGEMDITSDIPLKKRGAPIKYETDEARKEAKKESDKKRYEAKKLRNNPL